VIFLDGEGFLAFSVPFFSLCNPFGYGDQRRWMAIVGIRT
jgi:hypothetical protein